MRSEGPTTPIAIVGIGCEYPDAPDPDSLFANALSQRRAFRRLPQRRLDLADYHDPDPAAPDLTYAAYAAVLTDYEFDRVAHKVSGSTYRSTDLTHWLALDVAGRALADAGVTQLVDPERTGVVVGNTLTGEFSRSQLLRLRWPYVRAAVADVLSGRGLEADVLGEVLGELEATFKQPFAEITSDSLAGGLANVIAGRICNYFDFGGGGYTVDGACSSSLLAVTHGASALARGDLDLALVGGVDLSLDPFELVGFAKASAIAPDLMKVYDARSRGFWPGEGCGFVALMRADDAERLGCRTYAVLTGWGISSDGAGGTTRPEADGQLLALRRACELAGWDPASVVSYEGHGTGTSVGDATELDALTTLRGPDAPWAAISSIKANIGHTKAAAGLAGLIKATLSVHHEVIAPITGCETPHPLLSSGGSSLRVLREPTPWPSDRPVRAAVSSMGFGGINTHLVLGSADRERRDRAAGAAQRRSVLSVGVTSTPQDVELLPLAGADVAEVAARALDLAVAVETASLGEIRDLAILLGRDRADGPVRAAALVSGPHDAARRLRELALALERFGDRSGTWLDPAGGLFIGSGRPAAAPRIGLVFPGQAAPTRLDPGPLGLRYPELAAGLDLPEAAPGADLRDTALAQPAIVGCAVWGVRLLEMFGVVAEAAVGHSVGEIAALHWAGAYDGPTAVGLATRRGRAMADLTGEHGSMIEVRLAPDEAVTLATGLPLVVAAVNGAERVVLSGPAGAVAAVGARAAGRGVPATELKVSHAFHSPLLADCVPTYAEALAAVDFAAPARTVFSTVTGSPLPSGADLPALLQTQVLAPVVFHEALTAMAADLDLLVEVGPGRVFGALAADAVDVPVVSLDVGSVSVRGVLEVLAACYALGQGPDLGLLQRHRVAKTAEPLRTHTYLENPCEQRVPLESGPRAALDLTAGAAPVPQADAAAAARTSTGAESEPSASEPSESEPSSNGAGPAGVADDEDPLDAVRRIIATRAELPWASVTPEADLLSDLGLNSLSVAEIAAEAARALGVQSALAPSELAGASVQELTALLESARGAGPVSGAVPGVDGWVRAFAEVWAPTRMPSTARPLSWQVETAPGEDPAVAGVVGAAFASTVQTDVDGVLVLAPRQRSEASGQWLVRTLADAVRAGVDRVAVLHTGDSGGVLKTIAAERPQLTTRLLTLSSLDPADPLLAERLVGVRAVAETGVGYREVRIAEDGSATSPTLRPEEHRPPDPRTARLPFAADDVVLVAGGARGIGGECAAALAAASGCRIALAGRTRLEDDPQLAEALDRLAARGIVVRYFSADLSDPEAARTLVGAVEAELGPVTGWVHATGVNEPSGILDLTEAAVAQTLRAKVTTFETLAAALPDSVHTVVAFGSIIGRLGLHGEAHYALANEWLAAAMAEQARAHQDRTYLTLEWSVWSGAGMGDRLEVVESLARMGVEPIGIDAGVRAFVDLMAHATAAATAGDATRLVVAARFGTPPTVPDERPALPILRFLEQPRLLVPGVELITEATLHADTDLALGDHEFGGAAVLPGVLGLEAMAQVVYGLTGSAPTGFRDVRFDVPVTVPHAGATTIRIAALAREAGRVDLVVRSGSTDFVVDHFTATAVTDGPQPAPAAPEITLVDDAAAVPELYDSLLFHGPLFHRVTSTRVCHARELVVELAAPSVGGWFAPYLPQRLLLGDPGTRDAFLHATQAAIPHRSFLPSRVDRIDLFASVDRALLFTARQVRHDEREIEVDLEVSADGEVAEAWSGVVHTEIASLDVPTEGWSAALAAARLERALEEVLAPDDGAELVRLGLAVEGGEADPGSAHREVALQRAAGARAATRHRPDGRPELVEGPDGSPPPDVSLSDSASVVLAGTGPGVAVDLEVVIDRSPEEWAELLPDHHRALVDVRGAAGATGATDPRPELGGIRVWTAQECLRKAGVSREAPLVLDRVLADGAALFRSGRRWVLTSPLRLRGVPEELVVAVSAGPGSTSTDPARESMGADA